MNIQNKFNYDIYYMTIDCYQTFLLVLFYIFFQYVVKFHISYFFNVKRELLSMCCFAFNFFSLIFFSVSDLKYMLKQRSLPVSGPKPQLVERLKLHDRTSKTNEQLILPNILCVSSSNSSDRILSVSRTSPALTASTVLSSSAQASTSENGSDTLSSILSNAVSSLADVDRDSASDILNKFIMEGSPLDGTTTSSYDKDAEAKQQMYSLIGSSSKDYPSSTLTDISTVLLSRNNTPTHSKCTVSNFDVMSPSPVASVDPAISDISPASTPGAPLTPNNAQGKLSLPV